MHTPYDMIDSEPPLVQVVTLYSIADWSQKNLGYLFLNQVASRNSYKLVHILLMHNDSMRQIREKGNTTEILRTAEAGKECSSYENRGCWLGHESRLREHKNITRKNDADRG